MHEINVTKTLLILLIHTSLERLGSPTCNLQIHRGKGMVCTHPCNIIIQSYNVLDHVITNTINTNL